MSQTISNRKPSRVSSHPNSSIPLVDTQVGKIIAHKAQLLFPEHTVEQEQFVGGDIEQAIEDFVSELETPNNKGDLHVTLLKMRGIVEDQEKKIQKSINSDNHYSCEDAYGFSAAMKYSFLAQFPQNLNASHQNPFYSTPLKTLTCTSYQFNAHKQTGSLHHHHQSAQSNKLQKERTRVANPSNHRHSHTSNRHKHSNNFKKTHSKVNEIVKLNELQSHSNHLQPSIRSQLQNQNFPANENYTHQIYLSAPPRFRACPRQSLLSQNNLRYHLINDSILEEHDLLPLQEQIYQPFQHIPLDISNLTKGEHLISNQLPKQTDEAEEQRALRRIHSLESVQQQLNFDQGNQNLFHENDYYVNSSIRCEENDHIISNISLDGNNHLIQSKKEVQSDIEEGRKDSNNNQTFIRDQFKSEPSPFDKNSRFYQLPNNMSYFHEEFHFENVNSTDFNYLLENNHHHYNDFMDS